MLFKSKRSTVFLETDLSTDHSVDLERRTVVRRDSIDTFAQKGNYVNLEKRSDVHELVNDANKSSNTLITLRVKKGLLVLSINLENISARDSIREWRMVGTGSSTGRLLADA